ncbi:MAG: DUF302 domain-containing protein [Cocleimonas sp.]|nr:DUF302 domain-containing protein [Cocleimonas sp.]
MKRLLTFLFLILLTQPIIATTDKAQQKSTQEIIRKVSPYNVNETMNKLEAVLKAKHFGIFTRINHTENAKKVDLAMGEAQVIIFGNPKGGTKLMRTDIRVALDLPLRVVVYQDADDKVYIAYHNPQEMSQTYDLKGHKVIDNVTLGLDKITSMVIATVN